MRRLLAFGIFFGFLAVLAGCGETKPTPMPPVDKAVKMPKKGEDKEKDGAPPKTTQ